MSAPAVDQRTVPGDPLPDQPDSRGPATERLPDMDVIIGEGTRVTVNKIECTVKPVRTKAAKALINVYYAGIGPAMGQLRIDPAGGWAEIGPHLVALLMLAAPNAIDEVAAFLTIVLDAGDEDAQQQLDRYLLDDPDPVELIDAAEAVAVQEAAHLVEILGKAQAAWARVAPLYQNLMPTPRSDAGTANGDGDRSPRHSI